MTRLTNSKFTVPEEADEPRSRFGGTRGKFAVVALVLLAGVAAAVVFRKKPVEDSPAPSSSAAPLVLREDSSPAKPKSAPAPHLVGRIDPLDTRDRTAVPPTPTTSHRAAPPLLPSTYPAPGETANPARDQTAEAPPTPNTPAAPRVHRVRDGDTLSELARRYLGDGNRYMEIYDANSKANRGVLEDPDLLPIGAELTIPAADRPAQPAADVPPPAASDDSPEPQPLVPIPAGALKRGDGSAS